jgi:hypothetical protein
MCQDVWGTGGDVGFTRDGSHVVFSMLASYMLSRTLVKYLLAAEVHGEGHSEHAAAGRSWFARFNDGFNRSICACRPRTRDCCMGSSSIGRLR